MAAVCDNPEIIRASADLGANLTLRSELDESPMDVSCAQYLIL